MTESAKPCLMRWSPMESTQHQRLNPFSHHPPSPPSTSLNPPTTPMHTALLHSKTPRKQSTQRIRLQSQALMRSSVPHSLTHLFPPPQRQSGGRGWLGGGGQRKSLRAGGRHVEGRKTCACFLSQIKVVLSARAALCETAGHLQSQPPRKHFPRPL